jgi:hypothetical protein
MGMHGWPVDLEAHECDVMCVANQLAASACMGAAEGMMRVCCPSVCMSLLSVQLAVCNHWQVKLWLYNPAWC